MNLNNRNSSITDILDFIKSNNTFVLLGHQSIDADCLGSLLSLQDFLNNIGKQANIIYLQDLPSNYLYMDGALSISKDQNILSTSDAIIVLDTANSERISVSYKEFPKNKPVLNIDHHISNKYFALLNYVQDASSTGEVLFYLIEKLAPYFNETFETLFSRYDELLSAIYDDTGGLRYRSVTLKTLQAVYELVRMGANISYISQNLFSSTSKAKAQLIAKVSASLEFKYNDKLAFVVSTLKDLQETGTSLLDTDGLVDIPRNIDTVEVAFLMKEIDKEKYKFSFRSKSIDVNSFCAKFNGGGHKLAAGCIIEGPFEHVLNRVLEESKKLF